MLSGRAWAWALALILAASGQVALAEDAQPAQQPAAAAADPKPVDLQQALAGFKGFLVGNLIAADDTGLVLHVRAVTLIEGNQAPNPGALLGKEMRLALATEKGADGKEHPIAWLAETVKQLPKVPAIAIGGFGIGMGDEDAEVTMTVDPNDGFAGRRIMLGMTAQRLAVAMNAEAQVVVGALPPAVAPGAAAPGAGEPGEQKRPLITARVQADAKGGLVMDRVMPGSQPGSAWSAMPKLRITAQPEGGQVVPGVQLRVQPGGVPPAEPPNPQPKPTDF